MAKSELDELTRSFLKRWETYEMPTGQVTGGDMKPGFYRILAVLGWIDKKPGSVPTVGIQTLALRNQEDKHIGAITIGLPVTPRTELYVNAFLQSLGWDGRVWPYDNDNGWPVGTDDEDQLLGLIKRVELSSSLTFGPDPEKGGVPAMRFHVAQSHGAFYVAPFEEINSPPKHLERFRALVADPSVFHQEAKA